MDEAESVDQILPYRDHKTKRILIIKLLENFYLLISNKKFTGENNWWELFVNNGIWMCYKFTISQSNFL